ncbi:MAG: NADH:ubiquinone reductase (Na(+)-transporting) subunit D [Thermodesulfobacteriota bacterium]
MKNRSLAVFTDSIWTHNPIHIQMLGICSALAVTVQLQTSLVMGLALTLVVSFSSLIVSLLRKVIPRNIRIIAELTIISTLVILCDEFLKAFFYDISKQLSVFVGLIITNCIVLGRTESFALSNPPHLAFLDGLGNGLGYASVLTVVGAIRELLGAGTLLGRPVIPEAFYAAGYENMGFMSLAPAAFILIGLLVWLQKTIQKDR